MADERNTEERVTIVETDGGGGGGGVLAVVLLIIVIIGLLGWPSSIYLLSQSGQFRFRLTPERQMIIAACLSGAVAVCVATWWIGMRSGVHAVEAMRR